MELLLKGLDRLLLKVVFLLHATVPLPFFDIFASKFLDKEKSQLQMLHTIQSLLSFCTKAVIYHC